MVWSIFKELGPILLMRKLRGPSCFACACCMQCLPKKRSMRGRPHTATPINFMQIRSVIIKDALGHIPGSSAAGRLGCMTVGAFVNVSFNGLPLGLSVSIRLTVHVDIITNSRLMKTF